MRRLYSFILLGLLALTGCSVTKPDLGVRNGRLMPCPDTPNCVSSQATDDAHHISPLRFTGTEQQAKEHLLQLLGSEKRTRILTAREDYIRVEFRSAVFRFVDDVEFYFPESRSGETVIHVRSASRIGYSDLGVNRKRVERVRRKLSTTRDQA